MMSSYHQEINLDHQFGGGVGSTNFGCVGGNEEIMSNICRYDDLSSYSSRFENSWSMSSSSTNLHQPFHIFPCASAYSNTTPFKSLGGMAAHMVFPFTPVQWEELQRQTMIYKLMISSLPIPLDLLFPLSTPIESSAPLYNVRYSKNGDQEPWRCKRTDGKKWRCSRDVAPRQKYCERHLNRGRPRSRKLVEVKDNGGVHKRTRFEQIPLPNSTNSKQFVGVPYQSRFLFNAETDLKISTPSYKGTNRDSGLMLENEMVAMNKEGEQQWKHLLQTNTGFSYDGTPIYNRDYIDMFSYSSAFTTPEILAPIGFIDAWSLDNLSCSSNNGNIESSTSMNHGNLSPSLNLSMSMADGDCGDLTLSMAMAAGNVLDEEMEKIESGIEEDCVDDHKIKKGKWASPVSSEPFTRSGPGGPLAEALHPGSVLASPPYYDSISSSNPATAVSSPTGVVHRTLFSHSDGSVCNSPTLVAAPPSEIGFYWLN